MNRKLGRSLFVCLAAGLAVATASARQNVARNGSMELGPGPNGPDDRVALNWTLSGAGPGIISRSGQDNHTTGGAFSRKIFGGAPSPLSSYQDVSVAPGDAVRLTAFMKTLTSDRINGAQALIRVEFLNGSGGDVGSGAEVVGLTNASPPDVWTLVQLGPVTAPAGAAMARFITKWTHSSPSGSAFWDDVTLTVNNGPNLLQNSAFETAGSSMDNPFGIDDWTAFQFARKSDEQSLDGDFSVKLLVSGTEGDFSGLFQDTADVFSGDRIFGSTWIFNPVTGGLSGAAASALKFEFQSQSGSSLPPPEELLSFDADDPMDTWVLVTYTTTVPTGATAARLVLLANDTLSDNGPVYFDDAFADRSSTPGVNRILNPSFESGLGGANGLTNWTEFRGMGCQARKNSFDVPARTGSSVMRVSGNCVAGVFQDIDVLQGESLTVSSWLRQRSTMPFGAPAGSTAGVKVEWRNANLPPQVDIDGAPNNTAHPNNAPVGQWTNLFIDFTMPPASGALLRTTLISVRNGAPPATVYFDNVETVILNRFNGADVDGDNDQDLLDFAKLQACYNGAGGGLGWPCIVYDSDDDEDIDQVDAAFFFPRITGPATP